MESIMIKPICKDTIILCKKSISATKADMPVVEGPSGYAGSERGSVCRHGSKYDRH